MPLRRASVYRCIRSGGFTGTLPRSDKGRVKPTIRDLPVKHQNPPSIHVELGLVDLHSSVLEIACRKVLSMAKLALIAIPTEPAGSIPRPVDSREQFIDDLLSEHETGIRRLKKGAHKVQVDFTEEWLAVKISSFIDLSCLVLFRFSPEEVHRGCRLRRVGAQLV